MTLPRPLTGVIPPVCTPFTEDNDLDLASLERLVRFLLDDGVTGLFMLGSHSETATLTDAQRSQAIEVAVGVAAGQVPVLAGVIDMGTARMVAHGQAAKALGVDGLVATAPFYIRPSQGEIIEHYRQLHAAVDLPVFAYDIPQNVQTKLDRPTIATLAAEGTIAGLKDSSGNDGNFRGVLLDTREIEGFAVLTGSETTVDNALLMGAHGVVPGIGNVDPGGFVRIFNAISSGEIDGARREQERLFKLFAITAQATGRIGHTASALGGFKTALMLRGVIATNVPGRPMTRLNDAEVEGVRQVLVKAGLL